MLLSTLFGITVEGANASSEIHSHHYKSLTFAKEKRASTLIVCYFLLTVAVEVGMLNLCYP